MAVLLGSIGANAAGLTCTIHPKKCLTDTELATVTRADAETTALKAVNIGAASVESSELEAERGCLIFSFDIQIPDRKSIVEVTVGAGTGKFLSKKNAGPKAQAAERAADAAAKSRLREVLVLLNLKPSVGAPFPGF